VFIFILLKHSLFTNKLSEILLFCHKIKYLFAYELSLFIIVLICLFVFLSFGQLNLLIFMVPKFLQVLTILPLSLSKVWVYLIHFGLLLCQKILLFLMLIFISFFLNLLSFYSYSFPLYSQNSLNLRFFIDVLVVPTRSHMFPSSPKCIFIVNNSHSHLFLNLNAFFCLSFVV